MNSDSIASSRARLNRSSTIQIALLDRIAAEINFARQLIRLHPAQKNAWTKLIEQASAAVEQQSDPKRAVARAEEILAPIGRIAKQYTIHCIGHAHIDMNWLWSWQETVATTNDTFITVLKLMEEFPAFTFSQSQGVVYEIVRQYNPDLFAQIKQRIREGRWEVTAPHWVEGDKNLASGESLARHLLYTRRWMKQHLGLEPEDIQIDWEPDTFGHAHTIPAIDSRGGVKHYYCCRPGEPDRPPVFWWRAPDGSKLLVNKEINWYNSTIAPSFATTLIDFCEKTKLKDWMLVYGVGDHGGGPTRRDLRRIMAYNEWPIFPNWKFGRISAFFELLEKNGSRWPTLDQELNFEFAGCYTSQSAIKKINRMGENLLAEADLAAALAHVRGLRPYPAETLRATWRDVLFNHFHDILPGSGVPQTRQYTQGMWQRISAAAGMIKTHSLRALASQIDTSFARADLPEVHPEHDSTAFGAGQGRDSEWGAVTPAAHVHDGPRPIVVFNPAAQPRAEVVQCTIWDAGSGANPGDLEKKSFVVRSSDGKVVPAQKINAGDYWGHKFVDLLFPAQVGPMGYSTYCIEEGDLPAETPLRKIKDTEGGWRMNLPTGRLGVENEHLRVEFDRTTGGIISLIDKKTGRQFASKDAPLGVLEYVLERPGGMSAWVMHDVQKRVCPLEVESVSVVENNPWWGEGAKEPWAMPVTVKARLNDTRITIVYTLRAGEPFVDIQINTRWLEHGDESTGIPRLSMVFPTTLTDCRGRYEIPFGTIERPSLGGRDVPSLRFAEITGKLGGGKATRASLIVMNDCKYGCSLDGSTLRQTLIRASKDPDPLPEIGEHTIRLAIAPRVGEVPAADAIRLGIAFNHPLQVVNTDVHQGELPPKLAAGVACGQANVIVTQIKKAEDDDALIFRLQETAGRATTATVELARELFGAVKAAEEVDFLERPIPRGRAKASKRGFSVAIAANAIASVRVKLGR
jgi:alpha-mannosidase